MTHLEIGDQPVATLTSPAGSRRDSYTDRRRTTCKLCPFSVLVDDPAVWLTNPIGLSHTACARRAGLA